MKYFRNYDEFDCSSIGNLTIFTGPNAVGKTSVIEAIQLMTSLQSFRSSKMAHVVNWNHTQSRVNAHFQSDTRDLELKMIIENGSRSYYLNDKKKNIQQLKGLLPSVIFTPDDLDLAKGSNASRRDAIDSLASQLSKNFYSVKNDYMKLVKQKNQALKDMMTDDYIRSIDDVMIKVGVQLISYRVTMIRKIQPLFQKFYSQITNAEEDVRLVYLPFWLDAQQTYSEFDKDEAINEFEKTLADRTGEERSRQKAVVGPHSDMISFLLNDKNAVHFASQGQQRSIVLAFKLAELAVIQDTLNQRPILLLDDVMSELDMERRAAFMEFISDDIQTFITTTNIAYFNDDVIKKARVITLPVSSKSETSA